MKKIIAILLVTCYLLPAQAQEVTLQLKPKQVTYSQNELYVKVVSNSDDSAVIYYVTKDTVAGFPVEAGNKTVPYEALQILFAKPFDTGAANPILRTFNIEAIRRK